jgi:hypothetical protein
VVVVVSVVVTLIGFFAFVDFEVVFCVEVVDWGGTWFVFGNFAADLVVTFGGRSLGSN